MKTSHGLCHPQIRGPSYRYTSEIKSQERDAERRSAAKNNVGIIQAPRFANTRRESRDGWEDRLEKMIRRYLLTVNPRNAVFLFL
jgi:hypothetical protein